MISTIHWINEKKIGEQQLGIMARPRGNDWLEDEIKWLKIRRVDYLISLLESSEIWELDLEKEATICQELGLIYLNFPIKDVNIPHCTDSFISLAQKLTNYIRNGKKIVIHCRMGIGRSSMLTAAIMIQLGYKGDEVFKVIQKHRKLKVPDTNEQKKWVLELEEKLKKTNNHH